MKTLKSIPVGGKIIASVAIALISLITISILSITRIFEINATVENLSQQLAVEQRYSEQIYGDVLQIQIDMTAYIRNQKQEDLDLFTTHMQSIEDGLVNAAQFTSNEDRKTMISTIYEQIGSIKTTFETIVEILEDRETVVNDTLDPAGSVGAAQLQDIVETSYINDDSASVFYGTTVLTAFTNTQYATYKYLQTGDEDWANLVDNYYKQSTSYLSKLRDSLEDETLLTETDSVEESLTTYHDSVTSMLEGYRKQKVLESAQLDTVAASLQETAKNMSDDVQEDFAAAAELTNKTALQTEIAILISSIISIAISVLICILIIRSITRPLREVMEVSEKVANQDLNNLAEEMKCNKSMWILRMRSVKWQPPSMPLSKN